MAKVPCSVHPDEGAILYCLDCDSHQNACSQCIEEDSRHSTHKFGKLEVGVKRQVASAESLLESTEQEKLAAYQSFYRTKTFNEQVLHAEATELQQAMQVAEVDFHSITVNTAVESRVSDELSALAEPVGSLLQFSNDLVGLKPPKDSSKTAETTEDIQSQTTTAELFKTAVLAPSDYSTTESESPASNNAKPAEALAATIQQPKQLLILAGGWNNTETLAYDTSSDTWAQVKPLSCARGGTAATLWDGKMVVAGGWDEKYGQLKTVEQFDPESNCWTALPPMLHRRQALGLVTFDNSLFAIGGWDGTKQLDSVEQYNSNTKQWQLVAALNVARSGLCCAVLGVGILAAGGRNDSKRLSTCELLAGAKAKWKSVASTVTARCRAAAANLNDKVYVFGGFDNDNKDLDSVEQYDTVSDKWTLLPTRLSQPRWTLAAAAVNDRIYVCGGAVGDTVDSSVNTVDCFDAGVTQIKRCNPLPKAVCGAAALCLPVPDKLWNQLFK